MIVFIYILKNCILRNKKLIAKLKKKMCVALIEKLIRSKKHSYDLINCFSYSFKKVISKLQKNI